MAKSWNAADIAKKWSGAMNNGTTQANYVQVVMNLTDSPTARAATPEALANYQAGVNASVASGKRAAALQAVSLADYQKAVKSKAGNLGIGATNSQPKMQAAMSNLIPVWGQIQSTLAGMPRQKGNAANAKARVGAVIDAMIAAKKTS